MDLVLILGLGMTAVTLFFAGRRVFFLGRLITSGQPAPDRVENVTHRLGQAIKTQVVEVFGQKKLLKWIDPGRRALLRLLGVPDPRPRSTSRRTAPSSHPQFAIPLIGHWPTCSASRRTSSR